jgi:ABC-type lipoprotein export system ATPase subunit
MQLHVAYDFRPKTPSANAAVVADAFGIGLETGRHVVADGLELPIEAGDVVAFTGPSGSGKSSLMRAAAVKLAESNSVVHADALDLGDAILIDALGLPVRESLALLAACGLGEARLMLRTPRELSDGQRYRFRLALALAQKPRWVVADEFTATLDRTLAKVVAFNIRRIAGRSGTGFLLATTHEDVIADLAPSMHVRCWEGGIEWERRENDSSPRRVSFFDALRIVEGTKADWLAFARWHYRSHHLGIVRRVTLLLHGDEPVGICVFTSPPLALSQRGRYFGLHGGWSRTNLQALGAQLVTLSRVVLHPTYRGAGLAAWFIRESCRSGRWPWVEALAQMGHVNPFFEKAGFVRVGASKPPRRSRREHSAIYGGSNHGRRNGINRRHRRTQEGNLTQETHEKSRHARPVYYIFDNRPQTEARRKETGREEGDRQETHREEDNRGQASI